MTKTDYGPVNTIQIDHFWGIAYKSDKNKGLLANTYPQIRSEKIRQSVIKYTYRIDARMRKKVNNKHRIDISDKKVSEGGHYLSLTEAAKGTPYSQEYLSLLARRGKLSARKIGRNWYVTQKSVARYLKDQGEQIIAEKPDISKKVLEGGHYLSLAEASKGTPYSQEYLSLLVRRGKLSARKLGRNWYVTQEAVAQYLRAKGNQVIAEKPDIRLAAEPAPSQRPVILPAPMIVPVPVPVPLPPLVQPIAALPAVPVYRLDEKADLPPRRRWHSTFVYAVGVILLLLSGFALRNEARNLVKIVKESLDATRSIATRTPDIVPTPPYIASPFPSPSPITPQPIPPQIVITNAPTRSQLLLAIEEYFSQGLPFRLFWLLKGPKGDTGPAGPRGLTTHSTSSGGGGGGSVSPDSLDFDEFVDAMTLDADTTIDSVGFNLSFTGVGHVAIGAIASVDSTLLVYSDTGPVVRVTGDGAVGGRFNSWVIMERGGAGRDVAGVSFGNSGASTPGLLAQSNFFIGHMYNGGLTTPNFHISRTGFFADGNPWVTIDTTGRFGIGTVGPTALLHVVGTAPTGVATTPGTAATSVLTLTGAAGGTTSITTTGSGGVGSGIVATLGTGGIASAALTLSTGGSGGAYTLTGGAGGLGGATSGGTTGTGGAGGTFSWTAGIGGAATNTVSGTNTGGVGGTINLIAGTGGATNNGATNNAGAGGPITIRAGTGGLATFLGAAGTGGNGGLLTLSGGLSSNASGSAGGGVTITGQTGCAGCTTNSGGAGGAILLTAGAAGGDNTISRAGGNIVLTAGISKGTAVGAVVNLAAGAAGQNLTVAGAVTGPAGGASTLTLGAGGTAPNATTTSTGGAGGTYTISGGLGGAAAVGGAVNNTGGGGSAFTWNTGAGGAATGATSGNNLGGSGGSLTVTGGAGGAANNATGNNTGGVGSLFSLISGIGGAATGVTSGVNLGGAGGAFNLTTNSGGAANNSTLTNTGGAAGTFNLTGGTGGAATTVGVTNTGGGGSAFNLIAGAGGAANGGTTNNAGAGGAIIIRGGSGGIGTTLGGNGGSLTLGGGLSVLATGSAGGAVAVTGAAGTSTGTGGAGGALTLTAGNAGGNNLVNRQGGAVSINTGLSTGFTAGGAFTVTGGAAGTNAADLDGTATGPGGGVFTLTMGAAGVTSVATVSATGGAGGAFSITGGAGGAEAVAGTGSNTGGAGSLFTWITGIGGAATGATSGANLGGAGGALTLTTNSGGAANNSTLTNTGGAAGILTITGGSGGAATTAGVTNTGGGGSVFSWIGGTGGAANGATTNNGGAGGAITLRAGSGGVGTTLGGAGGALTLSGGTAALASGSAGGAVLITGAAGAATGNGGIGGALTLTAGAAGGVSTLVNRAGGTVAITAGASIASASGGAFTVVTGLGGAGSGGPGTTKTGGIGGLITFTMGNGGIPGANATVAATGGAGGAYTLTGGIGGAAAIAGTGTNTGGAGSTFTWTAGTGGAASAITSGINTGGIGGAITLRAGTGGVGSLSTLAGGNRGGAGGLLSLLGGTAAVASGSAGGGVSVTGAAGSATGSGGVGGALTFIAGAGGNSTINRRNGGAILLTTGLGGNITASSAASVLGANGGAMTLTLGNGGSVNSTNTPTTATGGNGGNFSLTAGTGGSALVAGATDISGLGGSLSFAGGVGGTNNVAGALTIGAGGGIKLRTGDAGSGNVPSGTSVIGGAGGALNLLSGAGTAIVSNANPGSVGGVGGLINIQAGNGGNGGTNTSTGGRGGSITLAAGGGQQGTTTSATGGDISILAGNSCIGCGNGIVPGNGGAITITGGAGSPNANNVGLGTGGAVTIQGGLGSFNGSGIGGTLTLAGGDTGTGGGTPGPRGGDVIIQGGLSTRGTDPGGAIRFRTSDANPNPLAERMRISRHGNIFITSPFASTTAASASLSIFSSATIGSVASISATALTSGSVFRITVPATGFTGNIFQALTTTGGFLASISGTGNMELIGYASVSSLFGAGLTVCSSSDKLQYNANGRFTCVTDQVGGGGGTSNLQIREFGPGATYDSFPATASFKSAHFQLTSSGSSDVTIALDWGLGGPASLSQNEIVTGAWTFTGQTTLGNTSVSGNFDPATDNTYQLGNTAFRWKSIFLGPGSLHISSTTGTNGAGADYTAGILQFVAGSSLSLGTQAVGAGSIGSLELRTNNTARLYVTGAGNVGIGTTAPQRKLHISGSGADGVAVGDVLITGTGGAGSSLTLEATSTNGRRWSILSTSAGASGGPGNFGIFDSTGSAYRLLIASASGNIGLNGIVRPAAKLSLGTATNVAAIHIFENIPGNNWGIGMGGSDFQFFTRGNAGDTYTWTGDGDFKSSPTKILMRLQSHDGKLGLGISNPATTLDVKGTSSFDPFNVASVSGTSFLRITKGGNVGIGTTTPTTKLDVIGNASVSGNFEVGGQLFAAALGRGASISGNFDPALDNTYQLGNTAFRWKSIFLGPGSLHISSTTGTSGTTPNYTDGVLQFNGASLSFGTSAVGTGSVGSLDLLTAGTSRLHITTGGNVGIGTTTPGILNGTIEKLLDIESPNSAGISLRATAGDGREYVWYSQGTAGRLSLFDATAGLDRITIASTGNVGIGTISPAAKLTITNNVATGFLDNFSEYQLLLYDGAAAGSSYGLGIKGGTMVFNSGVGAYSFDRSGNATSMVIDSAGFVGIGTTAPEAAFHLIGPNGLDDTSPTAAPMAFRVQGGTGGGSTGIGGNGAEGASISFTAGTGGTSGGAAGNGGRGGDIILTGGAGGQGIGADGDGGHILLIPGSGVKAGNVGIGKLTPITKLEVKGTASASALFIGMTQDAGAGFAICHPTDGATSSGEEIQDCKNGPGADYMEMYPMTPNIEEGEIVVPSSTSFVLDTTNHKVPKLIRSTRPYQEGIIGITSIASQAGDFNSIGYNINAGDNPKPLALSGRVLLKVSTDNGPIRVGDRITSSDLPGIGMKATQPGMTVGTALEDLPALAPGSYRKIMVFVGAQYWAPQVAPGNLQLTTPASGGWQNGTFQRLFASMLEAFSTMFGIVFEAGGRIKAKELCLDEVCVTKDQLRQLLQTSPSDTSSPTPTPVGTTTPLVSVEVTPAPTASGSTTPTPTPTPTPTSSDTPTPTVEAPTPTATP